VSGANAPWTSSAEAAAASLLALCARLESANIRLSAKCELILLHSSELQPRLGCKFKSVDAKAANCCLSQTLGLVPRKVGRDKICLLIGRSTPASSRSPSGVEPAERETLAPCSTFRLGQAGAPRNPISLPSVSRKVDLRTPTELG